jgi:hypothetical protein
MVFPTAQEAVDDLPVRIGGVLPLNSARPHRGQNDCFRYAMLLDRFRGPRLVIE